MAEVHPFRAIRYDLSGGTDLSAVIAPPYDVLSQTDKQRLLARDPHNIVAVDLPHTPPKSAGPAEAYQRSAALLRDWLARTVLVREGRPAVYAYRQVFEHQGRRLVRRGLIARVRAEPFRASPTGIFPHEQTFAGPREDRLALMRATHCQMSPIFGLFADEAHRITEELYAGLAGPPTMAGRLDNVEHQVWRVVSPAKIQMVTAAMKDRPIFIADGHHRYSTSLNYLAELERHGPVPADHPARFVMFALVSLHDPGLVILPTHRVLTVRPFALEHLAQRLAGPFEVTPARLPAEALEQRVLQGGSGWFGVKPAGVEDGLLLRLRDTGILDRLEAGRGQAYRRLDVAILHRYLIGEVLVPLAGEPTGVEYPHTGADAGRALVSGQVDGATSFGTAVSGGPARPTTKVAFLLAPTPLAAVREVCLAGELMPQKSTFFYPKLATGLTLYELTEQGEEKR